MEDLGSISAKLTSTFLYMRYNMYHTVPANEVIGSLRYLMKLPREIKHVISECSRRGNKER